MIDCCGHGNEHSIKCAELLDYLRNYQVLQKDCGAVCTAVAASQREAASTADRSARSLRRSSTTRNVFLLSEPVPSRAASAF
jgi:hypothetical protein